MNDVTEFKALSPNNKLLKSRTRGLSLVDSLVGANKEKRYMHFRAGKPKWKVKNCNDKTVLKAT